MAANELDELLADIRACRVCRDTPERAPLPHEPRPVLRVSASATIAVCGQAPGTRVHASGKPFTDPSGDRLRSWMAVDSETFYDTSRIAIVPMGFCFPGLDAKGADLPPRRECPKQWRSLLFEHLPNVKLILVIGSYAAKWHLGNRAKRTLTETVAAWRNYDNHIPLPHPSWRNNAWLKRHPWFEDELLPNMRLRLHGELEKC